MQHFLLLLEKNTGSLMMNIFTLEKQVKQKRDKIMTKLAKMTFLMHISASILQDSDSSKNVAFT